jgi:hypothetical protein
VCDQVWCISRIEGGKIGRIPETEYPTELDCGRKKVLRPEHSLPIARVNGLPCSLRMTSKAMNEDDATIVNIFDTTFSAILLYWGIFSRVIQLIQTVRHNLDE